MARGPQYGMYNNINENDERTRETENFFWLDCATHNQTWSKHAAAER